MFETDRKDLPTQNTDSSTSANVCYIILTCEKYIPTRVEWQKKTCFQHVPAKDCYFLSCTRREGNIYGWDTEDDYKSCIQKYIQFFQNMELDYDWYMFLDDDTFVYPNRVHSYLSQYDSTKPLYIGAMWTNHPHPYMSGGAGFFLTKSSYTMLRTFMLTNTNSLHCGTIYGDLSMGIWLHRAMGNNPSAIQYINDWEYFQVGNHKHTNELSKCITFHYVTSEHSFLYYNQYMNGMVHNPVRTLARSVPNIASNVSFSPDGFQKNGLRHCGYKCSSTPIEEENEDFLFRVIPARNGSEHAVSFQSINYPDHYLSPNHSNVIYISKIPNNLDNESWRIVKHPENDTFQILSLSKLDTMKHMRMTVSEEGVGDIVLSNKEEGIQHFCIYV